MVVLSPVRAGVLPAFQTPFLAEAQHLMLVNVLLVLLIVGSSAGIAFALVRRSVRERVEAARLAAMGTATARILHQVKNPLQTILLHAEMLQDGKLVADPALRGEISSAIVGEAMRMTELLAGLSAYASGVARRLNPQPMELHALVRDVVDVTVRETVHEAIEMRVGPLEEALIEGDPFFLREALGNVLRNAREALQERTDGAGAVLEVRLRRRGAEAVVEVKDSGPGIEPNRMAHVLEPFVTTKGKGMGLGLPICREIVEGHGGRIDLRSRPGVGTSVLLVLPLSAAGRGVHPA